MLGNVLEYLERAVQSWPERTAFADEHEGICFAALLDVSRRIGTALAACAKRQEPVAVIMNDRSVKCVAGLMGILQAGCFYVPLDAAAPAERLRLILNKLEPAAILTDHSVAGTVEKLAIACPIVRYEQAADMPADDMLLAGIRAQQSIYDILSVMYTSGSTGIPKGVAQSQYSHLAYTEATIAKYSFTQNTVFANQSPFFYANSIIDIYPPIALGATVYILPARCLSFPKMLVEQLRDRHITELTMTPSSYIKAANAGVLQPGCLPELEYIILSGEAAHWPTLKKWMAAAPNAGVWNFYGSTEMFSVAVWQIEGDFSGGETIPVGKPYTEVEVLIVDENGKPVPRGESGEMLIANPWLCSGYYRDVERTRKVFCIDPQEKGWYTRYYRTGDIGRIGQDGMLRVIGRKDSQIKRAGYRMELGEVELALQDIPGWENGCVLYDREGGRLLCFWEGKLTREEILRALKKCLPKYALPDTFVHLDTMPYTANMKIDREKLRTML